MSKKRFWPLTAALTVLAAAVAALVILYLGRSLMAPPSAERAALTPATQGLPVLWQAPDLRMPNHRGETTTTDSLKGRPWIASFFFTTCTTVCPRITANTVALQRQLGGKDLRFVSFSVDPEHDSVEALRAYAEHWGDDERWLLLRPDPEQVQALAADMRVVVEASDDPANPIVHTSMFFLVDQRSQVRGVYDSNDDAALARLIEDVGELLGDSKLEVGSEGAQGELLYGKLGCGGCHEDSRLAPSFAGLVGSRQPLEDGTLVTADRAYVRESIVAPGTKIVRGYLPLMPSYRAYLDDQQLDALVSHVEQLSQRGAADGGTAEQTRAAVVVDPVCHMDVRVTDDTPHATHEGHEYYFCAESCRKRFIADPEQFLNAPER